MERLDEQKWECPECGTGVMAVDENEIEVMVAGDEERQGMVSRFLSWLGIVE
ncbi:hypothetical protein ACFQGT_00010 [Natrialbaceae archaeon GCM10025810]